MAEIVLIAAIGIFVVGVVVGIICMVCGGIRREQRRYEEGRRFRQEHGIWDDPDASGHFLQDEAPDGVSMIARGVTVSTSAAFPPPTHMTPNWPPRSRRDSWRAGAARNTGTGQRTGQCTSKPAAHHCGSMVRRRRVCTF
jgi:hypothetical protein